MIPKDKAESLVDRFRVILMDEDTDCGNEILCTSIAIQHALIVAQNVILANPHSNPLNTTPTSTMSYWKEVIDELRKL